MDHPSGIISLPHFEVYGNPTTGKAFIVEWDPDKAYGGMVECVGGDINSKACAVAVKWAWERGWLAGK